MKNPWNDANWKLINMHNHPFFKGRSPMVPVEYKNSPILFCGSCDISGYRHNEYWYDIYCRHKGLDPASYSYIGSPLCTLSSLIRRIYAYLKITEVIPKVVLLVAPVSADEHMINGTCYSIMHKNDIMDPLKFVCRANIVPPEDQVSLVSLQNVYSEYRSIDQMVYEFCRDFSFLEMLCNAHGIKLYWTPNLTRNASEFYKHIELFLDAHEFAKNTFIGYTPSLEVDTMYGSPTAEAHAVIASLFLNADVTDL